MYAMPGQEWSMLGFYPPVTQMAHRPLQIHYQHHVIVRIDLPLILKDSTNA